jgi:hypothetical protein
MIDPRSRGGEPTAGDGPGAKNGGGAWVWPAAIIAGALVVVAVNIAFIMIAVDGADPVVPSYMEEER